MKDKYYYKNGSALDHLEGTNNLHRLDGPAVEYHDGSKEWWINGILHREDGPAAEYSNGYKCWYINGKIHREDGPAIEWEDGTKRWYINERNYDEEDYYELIEEVLSMDKALQLIDPRWWVREIGKKKQ